MKGTKRQEARARRNTAKRARYEASKDARGKSKSRYALKQRQANRPGSPFHTTTEEVPA